MAYSVKTGSGVGRHGTTSAFFSFPLPNLFFGASAIFILLGINDLVGPTLRRSHSIEELVPAYCALCLYQVALFGVALVLYRWRRILDDTVTLVAMTFGFAVACAMMLSTLAPEDPAVAFRLGLIGLGVVVVEWLVLRRWVEVRHWGWLIPGTLAALAVDFLLPSFIAQWRMDGGQAAFVGQLIHRWAWLPGFLCAAGGIMHFLYGTGIRGKVPCAFLHSYGMPLVCCAVVFVAQPLCIMMMGWMFSIHLPDWDFLPYVVLIILIAYIVLRQIDWPSAEVVLFPIFMVVAAFKTYPTHNRTAELIDWLWYPPAIMGACGLYLAVRAIREQRWIAGWAAATLMLGCVWTFHLPGGGSGFNDCAAGIFVWCVVLSAWAWRRTFAEACIVAAVLVVTGTFYSQWSDWLFWYLTPWCVIVLDVLYPARISKPWMIAATVMLGLVTLAVQKEVYREMLYGVILEMTTLTALGASWYFRRSIVSAVVAIGGLGPFILLTGGAAIEAFLQMLEARMWRVWNSRAASRGWVLVLGSFVFLAVGGTLSSRRARRMREDQAVAPAAAPESAVVESPAGPDAPPPM